MPKCPEFLNTFMSAPWSWKSRSLFVKIAVFAAITTVVLIGYTYVPYPSSLPSLRELLWRKHKCSPQAWNMGSWKAKPGSERFGQLTGASDALAYAGFEGCASDREYDWHLGVDHEEQFGRFPRVSSWVWTPRMDCDVRQMNREEMVRDLVERGGWLLIGDSVTENHFFSLSCMLYPHVRATPNYTENPYFDRAWPQHLYLSPTSPLLSTLSFPPGFSIENTPLVTFRRVDLLLTAPELVEVYQNIHHPPENFSLFSEERFWNLSPHEYMKIFTSEANYRTLVASTAGHWTTTVFKGLRDESANTTGYGIDQVLEFFEPAMKHWADIVQRLLYEDHRKERMSHVGATQRRSRERQVIVRAYLPGHESCHNILSPWTKILPYGWKWYNWPWIKDFNTIFQRVLDVPAYPNIHFLPIDRPARLRPDAHAAGDCLHIMSGAGVLEGWSHYIWHYVTRELRSSTAPS